MKRLYRTASLGVALALFTALTPALADSTVGGLVNKGLVGVGRIPAGQRDKFGETFGSGSGMAIDTSGWTHDAAGYKGSLWLLPDRGYNVAGTTDYRPRLNTIGIELSPVAPGAAPAAGQEQSWADVTTGDRILQLNVGARGTSRNLAGDQINEEFLVVIADRADLDTVPTVSPWLVIALVGIVEIWDTIEGFRGARRDERASATIGRLA